MILPYPNNHYLSPISLKEFMALKNLIVFLNYNLIFILQNHFLLMNFYLFILNFIRKLIIFFRRVLIVLLELLIIDHVYYDVTSENLGLM